MIQKDLIDKIVVFAEMVPLNFIGQQVKIEQSLSIVQQSFDRHFSATSKFNFILTGFMVRFSGNVMMFMGENHQHEIHCDRLIELTNLENGNYLLMEALSDKIYRRSLIQFAT